MMAFLYEYSLFLAKSLTILLIILIVLTAVTALLMRARGGGGDDEQLQVKNLNERFRNMEKILRHEVSGSKDARRHEREEKRAQRKRATDAAPKVFVLRFHGDIRGTRVDNLREEVTAILTLARPAVDRVVVCIDSGGGVVPAYGLAAAQLARLRDKQIDLTAAIDRIAASGGYMMAAVAQHIVAAPFAVVGSIGVVAQIPNVHRLLKRHDIDIELLTAGQHKRTLTVLGRNTPEGRSKFQQELDETHELFKAHLQHYRPQLDLAALATGEHWYGEQALALKLVDELRTSDDLLMWLARDHDLFEISFSRKQGLGQRMQLAFEHNIERWLGGGFHR